MSVRVTASRRRWLPLVGVCVLSLAACRDPEPTTHDLFDSFSAGVFVAESGFWRLGQLPGEPELPEAQRWTPLPLVPVDGWDWPGRVGWHPIGARAVLAGPNRWTGSRSMRLDLEWHRRRNLQGTQQVAVSINGIAVGSVELSSDRRLQSVDVPGSVLQGDRLEVALEFAPPLARGEDRLFEVTLAGFGLSPAPSTVTDQQSGYRIDAEDRTIRIQRSGSLIVGIERSPEFESLIWEVRCRGESSPPVVSVSGLSAGSVSPGEGGECGAAWERQELKLNEGLRGRLAVQLTAEVSSAGGAIEVRGMRLEGGPPGATARVEDRAGRDEDPERPPDVLLVVLDAARADHFGFSGYFRDTTPNVDQLAEESLVFTQAYSECATTSCSIPNLISGVPFLGVGTVFEGRKIPEEVVTLAEYLAPLGYRSVGLSANPNNSGRRNSHQGFDSFRKVSGTPQLNEMAIEAIREQPPEQPLFLQLHYMPPHQPYAPPPEFDVFTDPDYRGPVHPSIDLRPYSLGIRSFSDADVEELVGLYDGLLRWGDFAVSRVFEAMRAAGRWQDTIVVVTADHGEAFGEHGHFSHNSTLFEEMIHVPLVLRLPGEEAPEIDTRRPVTLADVVPTLLGRLGLRPHPEVRGVDLLRQEAGSDDERVLFFRTFHRGSPFLGVRSGRWKLIDAVGFRSPMLFDLGADRAETRNLSADHPEVFAHLASLLRRFVVEMEERGLEPGEEIVLPADEIEALKALGYVE